ncbi:hypothetical protein R6Q57_002705 [Mikania cordata]
MGASTKEKGVLKLVHPGRHVEYHRKPITAGEIMRKNPRHSITRPDFFKKPDIVVRPESVMVPGQVFYIVPNMTIHRMVKNQSQQLGQSLIKSSTTSHYDHVSKPTSPTKLWAGTTPMYGFNREHEGSSSCEGSNSLTQAEETSLDDGLTLTFQARDYYHNGNTSAWGITLNYGQQDTRSYKQDNNRTSCMKKPGRVRSTNLRVNFDFVATMIQY